MSTPVNTDELAAMIAGSMPWPSEILVEVFNAVSAAMPTSEQILEALERGARGR